MTVREKEEKGKKVRSVQSQVKKEPEVELCLMLQTPLQPTESGTSQR